MPSSLPSDPPGRVCVVDDDPTTLAAMAALLAPEFEVVAARNGRDALRLIRRDPPDLVLLDVQMPGLDGFAVCRRLKADPLTEGLPVVFLTAQGDEATEVDGLAAGAADFITKPPRGPAVCARVRNLVRMKRLAERLRLQAQTDALTGLANRAQFMRVLAAEVLRAQRQRAPLSVLMIDVDHFKAYNDHYGHLSGDGALRQVAQAIQRSLRRAGDLACRYGGEEFAMLLPATDAAGALRVGQAVCAALQDSALPHQASPTAAWVTASIGTATLALASDDGAQAPREADTDLGPLHADGGGPAHLELLDRADHALYAAKRAGRNRVHVADEAPAMPTSAHAEERPLR
jgi:diguanylate cyclase (GGDEF)-like protein